MQLAIETGTSTNSADGKHKKAERGHTIYAGLMPLPHKCNIEPAQTAASLKQG